MAAIGNLPGVPALLTGFSAALSVTQNPIVRDVLSVLGFPIGPQWGIFDKSGASVIVSDTVVDLSFKNEWVIADYPIEQGGFVSYDKVASPFEARVRIVAGGSISNLRQQEMLASIEAIASDTNLYDVVTPIKTYHNCNIRHYDYHRSVQNGLGVLAVDVWLSEIRIALAASTSTTALQPWGAQTVNSGAVQPTSATPAEVTQASGSWTATTY